MRAALIGLFALAACGGTAAQLPAPALPQAAAASPAPIETHETRVELTSAQVPTEAADAALPTECASKDGSVCTPPEDFVKKLCDMPREDVTLALFNKGTPFTRLYLRGKYDELAFDEEVLALRRTTGGIVVNGGTYDVLRWDGTCSTGVQAEMLTRTLPPKPRAARMRWSRIAEPLQISLIVGSKAIKAAHAKQGKECMGASFGVSPACVKADDALNKAIVDYVRAGTPLPAPSTTVTSAARPAPVSPTEVARQGSSMPIASR